VTKPGVFFMIPSVLAGHHVPQVAVL